MVSALVLAERPVGIRVSQSLTLTAVRMVSVRRIIFANYVPIFRMRYSFHLHRLLLIIALIICTIIIRYGYNFVIYLEI